jgi:predicted nucleic acid-binding protein
MSQIFLDTDIILDLLLERVPYHFPSMLLFEKAERKQVHLFASSVCFTNLFYILRKSYSRTDVYRMLNEIVISVNILSVDSNIVKLSLLSGLPDFEDSVQMATAAGNKMDVILTRNVRDYKNSEVPVMTPDEFLNTLSKN